MNNTVRDFEDELSKNIQNLRRVSFYFGYYEGLRKSWSPEYTNDIDIAINNAKKISRYSIILPANALIELIVIDLCKLFYRPKRKAKSRDTVCIEQLIKLLEEEIKSGEIKSNKIGIEDVNIYRGKFTNSKTYYDRLVHQRNNFIAHTDISAKPLKYTPKDIEELFKIGCDILGDISNKVQAKILCIERSRLELEKHATLLINDLRQ